MLNITKLSAKELARRVRQGELTAVDLVTAHLERIEDVNPQLNAVVQTCPDDAIRQAELADRMHASGEVLGPLHGIPFTVKDSFDTAGLISTAGTLGRSACIPKRHATVVRRLIGAGAILIGKTNTPELTVAFETDNLVYGRTNNPFDLRLSPGGSSGGSAAILAACGSPLEIGSDSGGSIRYPAHCCGVVGLKPTAGRVPRTGHIIDADSPIAGITQVGPLARTVADLRLVLEIITGPDQVDPDVVPMDFERGQNDDLQGLRLAWFKGMDRGELDADVDRAIDVAKMALADAGMRSAEAHLPVDMLSQAKLKDGGLWIREALDRWGPTDHHHWLEDHLDQRTISLEDRYRQQRSRVQLQRAMLAFMRDFDLILCPVNPYPAQPHDTWRARIPSFDYTSLFNLLGWPAISVPAGVSDDGLPIGVQLVAMPWREELVLTAAHRVESQLDMSMKPQL